MSDRIATELEFEPIRSIREPPFWFPYTLFLTFPYLTHTFRALSIGKVSAISPSDDVIISPSPLHPTSRVLLFRVVNFRLIASLTKTSACQVKKTNGVRTHMKINVPNRRTSRFSLAPLRLLDCRGRIACTSTAGALLGRAVWTTASCWRPIGGTSVGHHERKWNCSSA